MKFLNWILGILITLALLILLAILIVPRVIDPNDYREQITDLVEQQTGRELQLNGDLDISVFPWLGVHAKDLVLEQPDSIGGEFVAMESAQLRVKALPLLDKRVEVDTIVLQSPRISLITLKDGSSSLDGFGETQATSDQVQNSPTDPSAGEAAVALIVQGVEISNAEITIDDQSTGSKTVLRDLNIITGDLLGEELAALDVSGELIDASSSPLKFSAKGLAKIDQATAGLSAQGLDIEIEQGDAQASAELERLSIEEANFVSAKNLKMSLEGVSQAVLLSVPELSLDLAKESVSAATVSATFEELEASLEKLKVNGFESPTIDVALEVPSFDPRPLLQTFEIDYAPEQADSFSRVSLASKVKASLDSVELNNLVFNLDDTVLKGTATIRDFEQPKLLFSLDASTLDLDEYLPKEASSESSEGPELSTAESLAVPMAVFQQLNANGQLRVQELIAGGVSMQDIVVKVESQGQQFTVTPTAKLYEGKLDGQLAFIDSATPELRIKQEMDLVDLGRLLADADLSEQLRGLGSLDVDILVREEGGVQHNSGVIKINADNGELSGFDMHALLQQANSVVSLLSSKGDQAQEGDAQADGNQSEQGITQFAKMNGTFNLDDFVLSNNDLEILAPAFRLSGEGQIDIQNQTIDYLARLSVDKNVDGVLGEKLEKIKGQVIPIRCRGSLNAPLCLPDTKELYKLYLDSRVAEKKADYLREEFGVEGGESLSTKDALKQILINKALKKDKPQSDANQQLDSQEPIDPQQSKEQEESPEEAPVEEEESLEDQLKRKLLESLLN